MSDRRNIAWNVAGGTAGIASTLLLLPVSLDVLGASGYGIWLICFTTATLLIQADLGISTALVRFLAHASAKDASADGATLVTGARWMLFGLAVAYPILVSLGLGAYFGLTGMTESEPLVPLFVAIAAISSGLGVAGRLYTSILQASNRFDVERKSAVGTVAVRVLLVASTALFGLWPPVIVIAEAATLFMPGVVCAVYYHVRLRNRYRHGSRGDVAQARRRLLQFGMSVFASSFASTIALQAPLYLVGAVLGPADALVYGIAIRIFQSARMAYQWIAAPALPRLVRASTLGNSGDFARRSLMLTLWITSIGVLASGLLLFAPASILTLWLGPEYASSSAALQITGVALLCFGLTVPGAMISAAVGSPGIMIGPNFMVAGITLAIAVPLTAAWGAVGALLALTVALTASVPWVVLRSHSVASLDLARSSRVVGLIIGAGLIPMGIVFAFTRESLRPAYWLALVVLLVAASTLIASLSVSRRISAAKGDAQ